MKKVGIDSLSYYVPSLYVDIEELALAREIPSEKLVKGLGLKKMATPDYDEDSASIAANSLYRLIKENNIDPRKIGRVYLGTESGVDASKPIVFTCGSGMTACVLGMAYSIISGKNAVIYDGSWSEYGKK